MTKRVTTDELSAYLDGELSESERERVGAEIDRDPGVARLLEELRAVDQGVRRAAAEPPAAYFDGLPGRIRARLPVPARRARWGTPVWGLAAAAALFAAVLTPLALRDRPSPVSAPAPAAAKPPAVEAPGDVPAASPPPATLPAPAREVGGLARTEADARQLRDEQPAKRRDRLQVAESKVQPRATPGADLEGRLASKDDATGRDKLKGMAEEVTVPAQQGFAEPPRPAPAQEFGPRVSQQQAVPPPAGIKKEATAPAAPPPAEKAAPAGFAESVTVTQEKNVAGLRAAATPAATAPVEFLTRKPTTAAAARSLRDEARRFAETRPTDPRADAARVRVIELGVDAWRKDGRAEDRDAARGDALAYLAREDARQKERVRELLQTLRP